VPFTLITVKNGLSTSCRAKLNGPLTLKTGRLLIKTNNDGPITLKTDKTGFFLIKANLNNNNNDTLLKKSSKRLLLWALLRRH
jgi:hypothetical protein